MMLAQCLFAAGDVPSLAVYLLLCSPIPTPTYLRVVKIYCFLRMMTTQCLSPYALPVNMANNAAGGNATIMSTQK